MREIGKSSVGVCRVTEYFDSDFENFYSIQIWALDDDDLINSSEDKLSFDTINFSNLIDPTEFSFSTRYCKAIFLNLKTNSKINVSFKIT